jgi:4-oxalocrotonate tautomerase
MPIIQVNMMEGRSEAQKRDLIAKMTDAVVAALGAPRESVRIMINEMKPEHFAVGGVSFAERKKQNNQS